MSEEDKFLSQEIEEIRDRASDLRRDVERLAREKGFKDWLTPSAGALTCIIQSLYDAKAEVTKFEISREDEERGEHISFRSRGIGRETCPCCFVSGKAQGELHHNIAAYINSKEDGERLVEWFGGRAKLDYRPSTPNYIQLKVGVCEEHLPSLEWLHKKTSTHGVIRQADIEDAIAIGSNSG